MSELHKRNEELIFVPEEGQRNPLCSNRGSSRCPSLGENLFSQETINSIIELGEVLKTVRKRMSSEGYTIVDGQVKKLDVIKF
ncbi:MAG: hypothetical protein ABID54_00680 [Pseudomonadota bacterium]